MDLVQVHHSTPPSCLSEMLYYFRLILQELYFRLTHSFLAYYLAITLSYLNRSFFKKEFWILFPEVFLSPQRSSFVIGRDHHSKRPKPEHFSKQVSVWEVHDSFVFHPCLCQRNSVHVMSAYFLIQEFSNALLELALLRNKRVLFREYFCLFLRLRVIRVIRKPARGRLFQEESARWCLALGGYEIERGMSLCLGEGFNLSVWCQFCWSSLLNRASLLIDVFVICG